MLRTFVNGKIHQLKVTGLQPQVVMSRTPAAFRTVLVPRGSSKPQWQRSRG